MRKVWKLPNLPHCNLLPVITNCLPLNIILEKRLLKFIWSIINSDNLIVNKVFKFTLNNLNTRLNAVLGIKIGHILIVVFLIL